MADLIQQVVADGVLFGVKRLLPLVADDQSLATQLGVNALDPAATAQLTAARNDLNASQTAANAGDAQTAAQKLAAALTELEAAVAAVADPHPSFDQVLTSILSAAGSPAGALASQLGLTGTASLTHTGAVLTVSRSAPSASISAGPIFAHLAGIELAAELNLGGPGPALALTLTIAEATIGVAGDGLSQALLQSSAPAVRARLVVTVTSDLELHVGGGTAATVQLPAVTAGGPLQVKGLQVSAPSPGQPNAGGLDLGATISVDLGGATFLISGAGLRVGFAGGKLSLAARPPDGVGISVDAGLVKGGGYLASRPAADGSEEYDGALDLRLGFIEIKAFGILNVGGDVGFALIIVLTAEFQPGIQIGLGFTLDGVGGLVGIQHVVDVDAIAAALAAHTLDSLLFPDDPVSDAPRILATLGTVFPLRKGGAVFGPMIRLGWATFVTAELGVILSLPEPTLVIIGRLKIRIPGEFLPIVSLTADLLGVITPEKLFIRVSLVDSHIAGFTVGGDFGLLIRYSGDPEFALSAGGFHPAFTPPPELQGLARISIDMSPPIILTLRASAYAAITSATIQFGAKVEIGIDLEIAGADGHLSFDALIRFLPEFGFLADIDAGVSVHAFGFTLCAVTAHLSLSGTSPWRVVGTGSADFGWFGDVDIDFGPIEWGDPTKPPPVTVDVVKAVVDALSKPEAWTPELPSPGNGLVHLRPFPPSDELPLHPLGNLVARQSVLPFETEMTHLGDAVVAPGAGAKERLTFGAPIIGAGVLPTFTSVEDRFAMGQFLDLSDADALARPAFEERIAGIKMASADFASVDPATLNDEELTYETFVAGGTGDPPPRRSRRRRDTAFVYGKAPNVITLAQTALSRSGLHDPYAELATGPVEPILLADAAKVTVRSPDTLAAVAGFPATFADAMTLTDATEAVGAAGLTNAVTFVRLGVGA
ncbi:MAG: hypothetical protein JWN96_994 [Mycobacterium sp.]|nr:hypothetical protein [Mycobacterium sp.]